MSMIREWGMLVVLVVAWIGFYPRQLPTFLQAPVSQVWHSKVSKMDLAGVLGDSVGVVPLPPEVTLLVEGKPTKAIVEYAVDAELQSELIKLYQSYKPDYGAFVAMEADTGRILALVSYSRNPQETTNWALKASFPAASVFKVVTAAAAIAERKFSAESLIPFNGRYHTLYKSQILSDRVTRWTRSMTLKEAFAKSVNTVFGKLGVFSIGAPEMRDYAGRFGFNRTIAADFTVQPGKATISDDPFRLAESASGFTRDTTMSPIQGALIAASVVNGGQMMEPFIVSSLKSASTGDLIYQAEPRVETQAMNATTAGVIRTLMRQTIIGGTSRRSFRGFSRGLHVDVEVGGKTGSLTGANPPGKYDWFVGYANGGGRKIAVSALTINEKVWRVKSSYLARRVFEKYFRPESVGHYALRFSR